MIFTDTVVAYHVHDRASVRHIMRRNGQRVAVCGEELKPFSVYRTVEGFEADLRDQPEATCTQCLIVRAIWLVREIKDGVKTSTKELMDALDSILVGDYEKTIALLLADLLKNTSVSERTLIQEHFPRSMVEQAVNIAAVGV